MTGSPATDAVLRTDGAVVPPSTPTQVTTTVVLSYGEEAQRLLAADELAAAWSRLGTSCPWTTTFQGRPFVRAWFDHYGAGFAPVLVLGTSASGALFGLFVLGHDARTGELVVAGAHQAEYHGWIAEPEVGEEFGRAAVEALAKRFPRASLALCYAAPGMPVGWLSSSPYWRRRALVRPLSRALVDLSSDRAVRALSKGSNRSRLNRLRRLGDVRLERVVDPAELARVLDEVVPLYDLRQAGENGVLPFGDDARKRPFQENLFAKGLLHVTVLRVGARVAAAHLGFIDGENVGLGVFAHAPSLAEHSPGKMLLYLLFERLRGEGFRRFDMTPGPGWKDRFATHSDDVSRWTICFGSRNAAVLRARLTAERWAKRAAVGLGTTPDAVRETIGRLETIGARGLLRSVASRLARLRCWVHSDVECCIYHMDAASAARAEVVDEFAVDRIEDLLLFVPMESWQTRRDFLRDASARLAEGHHVVTRVEDCRLVAYGWLVPRQSRSFVSEIRHAVEFPPNSSVTYDYRTHSAARGRGLQRSALATALRLAASNPGTQHLWIGVLADNGPSRHNCVKMGWRHHASLRLRVRLGRRTVRGPSAIEAPALPTV